MTPKPYTRRERAQEAAKRAAYWRAELAKAEASFHTDPKSLQGIRELVRIWSQKEQK